MAEVRQNEDRLRALVEAGLHPASGGPGTLACSGDLLLQALVACAGVTLRAVATSLEIAVSGTVRAEGDLDVGPIDELEDRARVDRYLAGVDVAGDAGRRDELHLGGRAGVEEGEAVVDAGVDVEDQRDPLGHGRYGNAAAAGPTLRYP